VRSAARRPAVAPRITFTVIRASRDHSWLSIRIGGANGREVYRGTLERGHALRYGLAKPVWMRMGRPHALDIHVGNALVGNLPQAPSNLLLTSSGARR
jgi:hypothetical protein